MVVVGGLPARPAAAHNKIPAAKLHTLLVFTKLPPPPADGHAFSSLSYTASILACLAQASEMPFVGLLSGIRFLENSDAWRAGVWGTNPMIRTHTLPYGNSSGGSSTKPCRSMQQ